MVKKYSLSDISIENSLRFDVDYLNYKFSSTKVSDYAFSKLFEIEDRNSVTLPDIFKYCEIGNVEESGEINPVSLNKNERDEFNEPLFKKIEKGDVFKPDLGSILISSVRPNLRKIVYCNNQRSSCYYTKAFLELKPLRNGRLLYYLLRAVFIEDLIAVSRQGKGYPTIKATDLNQIKFNKTIIDSVFTIEQEIENQIIPLEEAIEQLRTKKKDPATIIDKVFSDYFHYDLSNIINSKNEKRIHSNLEEYSKNKDLRMDFRFHSKYHEASVELLSKFCSGSIKDNLLIPIRLGSSISPDDYDIGDSNILYLSMASIKNWEFDTDIANRVKESYWIKNKDTSSVNVNDILLARSGEGTIGKVAIIEEDFQAIFCDFSMRIALQNYDPKFAYFFFRTTPFQALIESNKKGLGNNTNIFPIQIQDFPLPNISIEAQKNIASVIASELDSQKNINIEIMDKVSKIESIIKCHLPNYDPSR